MKWILEKTFAVLGRIYSSFMPMRLNDGLVVRDGKVLYLGDADSVMKISRELGAEIINYGKKTIIPGFIDSHMHLNSLGMSLMTLDLRGTKSIDELKLKLRKFIEGRDKKIVIGRGWDQELFSEGRWPNAMDLDEAIKDAPVILVRVCGHAAVMNSAAISLLPEEELKGPYIQKDERGRPTGLVFEDAVGRALSILGEALDKREMLRKGSEQAARLGVTSVGFMSAKRADLFALKDMKELEELKTRVFLYMDHAEISDSIALDLKYGTEMVKLNGIKLFADGSFGARTALLSEPYSDDPSTRGTAVMKEDELAYWMKYAIDRGLQTATHAIGDAALDSVLKAMEISKVKGLAGRIEHASLVRPDQVDKMRTIGVGVSVQPRFVISDWWLVKRLGKERARYAYPFKTLINAGLVVGFSTDAPVEPLDPWLSVNAAVGRGEEERVEIFELTKHERLSLAEALHAYTAGSAELLGANDLGKLEIGKRADFVVVNADPFSGTDLKTIRVLETFIEGTRVYSATTENLIF